MQKNIGPHIFFGGKNKKLFNIRLGVNIMGKKHSNNIGFKIKGSN
jgi:hypothetical protein